MDYRDEQTNEIEALDSIYCGDMEILEIKPFHKFTIPIKSEEYEPETNNGLTCRLEFTYTPKYPEEPLIIDIQDQKNFEDGDEQLLTAHLAEQMKENLGMVMVFTLVSAAQEWLNVQWDRIKIHREESAALKIRQEEEAEQKRFEGTRVTVETFMTWKEKFDEETGITERREIAELQGKKLTGRELFMTDKTLDQSDLTYLDDGNVKVDASLFQALEDLAVGDDGSFPDIYSDSDDDGDPDFDPGKWSDNSD